MGIEKFAFTPKIVNKTLTNANQEYSYVIPRGTQQLRFKARDTSDTIRWSWESGKVATPNEPYATLASGTTYVTSDFYVEGSNLTLYLASPDAGTVVEIEIWG